MTNYKKQLLSVLASGAMMLNTALPVYAETVIQISGNGSSSTNAANVTLTTNTTVVQNNTADIDNYVDADASTGNNDANDNTGGDVDVDTGDATVNVSVSNAVNSNSASVDCCPQGDTNVTISGNGTNSNNTVDLDQNSTVNVFQDNNAEIDNDVYADAKTGKNDANDNTGGDVSIDTGNADVDVSVDNMVNFNWADVDCGCLLDLLAKIADNGTDTTNDILLALDDSLDVFQDNECGDDEDCDTDVYADAKTGKNDAEDNTGSVDGGDPSIDTGDAESVVDVSNSGNVNSYGNMPEDWPDFEFNLNLSLSWEQLMALLGLL